MTAPAVPPARPARTAGAADAANAHGTPPAPAPADAPSAQGAPSVPAVAWRPTATREVLVQRAALLDRTRRFFADRNILEVDTPIVVNAPVTDVHIHSAKVDLGGPPTEPSQAAAPSAAAAPTQPAAPPAAAAPTRPAPPAQTKPPARALVRPYFLHTSPEYAMKRLLAAGSGDIYQICHVVRGFERGRFHNSEFTLVEWYRLGFSLGDLMSEVDALVRALLGPRGTGLASERITYREAFLRELQLDPFTATMEELRRAAGAVGFTEPAVANGDAAADATGAVRASNAGSAAHPPSRDSNRDELLELLMGAVIGPRLGANALTFIHCYPASQAALARIDPSDPRAALRFELYCEGVELANGFHELASASEQRARFEQDNEERRRAGLQTYRVDELLLAALEAGLPECAGVALGFDRTVMLAVGVKTIDEVLAFPTERA